jgi:hypothetical protein
MVTFGDQLLLLDDGFWIQHSSDSLNASDIILFHYRIHSKIHNHIPFLFNVSFSFPVPSSFNFNVTNAELTFFLLSIFVNRICCMLFCLIIHYYYCLTTDLLSGYHFWILCGVFYCISLLLSVIANCYLLFSQTLVLYILVRTFFLYR